MPSSSLVSSLNIAGDRKEDGEEPSTLVEMGVSYATDQNRVVHSSHFRAIFGSFLISFLISFFKNGLQNEMKIN